MDIETFRLASRQISATQKEEQHHSNVSLEVHTDLRFSRCSRKLSVWRHRIENLERDLVVAKGVPRTFRRLWVGRTEESDEHPLVNEIGHVVRVRTARRCVENKNSVPDVVKLTATPYFKPVEVQERDVLRRKDAKRPNQYIKTSTWYDVKHVDSSIV